MKKLVRGSTNVYVLELVRLAPAPVVAPVIIGSYGWLQLPQWLQWPVSGSAPVAPVAPVSGSSGSVAQWLQLREQFPREFGQKKEKNCICKVQNVFFIFFRRLGYNYASNNAYTTGKMVKK